jgi:YD repeat-containing protein
MNRNIERKFVRVAGSWKAIITFALLLLLGARGGMAQQNPNQFKGFDPEKMYAFSNLDNVNTFNGNLLITIPLVPSVPVNAQLSYGATAVYNANVWDYEMTLDSATAFPNRRSNAGLGWIVSFGRLFAQDDPSNETHSLGTKFPPAFVFEGADGASHVFEAESLLTSGQRTSLTTIDESFLRMTKLNATSRTVEFPDGRKETFDLSNDSHADRWRPVRLEDKFGNMVSITYPVIDGYYEVWDVHDTHQRHQTYYFMRSDDQTRLVRIITNAFSDSPSGNTTAQYDFTYVRASTPRPLSDRSLCSSSPDPNGGPRNCISGSPIDVWYLTRIALPTGETYSMETASGAPSYSIPAPGESLASVGHIQSLQLPTRGRIEWTFKTWTLTRSRYFPPKEQMEFPPPSDPSIISTGVGERKFVDTDGSTLTWTYQQHTSASELCMKPIPPSGIEKNVGQSRQLTTAVTSPDGTTKFSYFSIATEDLYGCENSQQWDENEYGLPFTRYVRDAAGRFLSSELMTGDPTLPQGSSTVPQVPTVVNGAIVRTKQQSSYVAYDLMPAHAFNGKIPTASLTRYDRDLTCGAEPCFTESRSKNYDEFGHFRQQTSGGNMGAPYTTSFTDYASAPPAPNWILGLYTTQCQADDPSAANADPAVAAITSCAGLTAPHVAHFCFDLDTGFLKSRRLLTGQTEGVSDLTIRYRTTMGFGNVDAEEYFGGDQNAPGSRPNPTSCDDLSGTPQYSILRTYAGGMIASQKYAGVESYAEKNEIDLRTGLIRTAHSAAWANDDGLATDYRYDLLGRVTWIRPRDTGAWSHFVYNLATSTAPASVDVLDFPNGVESGAPLRQTHYYFDGFGRLRSEKRSMAGRTDLVFRTHGYDAAGRKVSVSDWAAEGESAPFTLRAQFDPFGRPERTISTDGSVVSLDYFGGVHKSATTQIVRTIGGDKPAIHVNTTDERGRLLSVSEQSGADENLPTVTRYAYDAANHLTVVTTDGYAQTRSFQYDNRGFLLSETHPENGATVYEQYDARGHAHQSHNGQFALTYEFDAAERPLSVTQSGTGPLSEMHYDRANAAGDFSMGKVDYAIRHNHNPLLPAGDVTVTERYTYKGTQGARSEKETTLSTGQVFHQGVTTNDLGLPDTITYPDCTAGCGGVVLPPRTVTNDYESGMLTGVRGFTAANGITYHTNGSLHEVMHAGPVPVTDTYERYQNTTQIGSISVRSSACAGPPLNVAEPADVTQAEGQPVTLSVTAPATPTEYQWYRGVAGDVTRSQLIAGATSRTFTALLTETASYWVRVGVGSCTTDSRAATVTVPCSGVSIVTQPVDTRVDGTGRATLRITVSPADATIDWYKGMHGDTTTHVGSGSSFITEPLQETASWWARVTAANGACVRDSVTVLAQVCTVPVIVRQPVDTTGIPVNGTASISVDVAISGGEAPYTFQWLDEAGAVLKNETKNEAVSTYAATITAGAMKHVHCVIGDHCGHTVATNTVTLSSPDCDFHVADFGPTLAYIAQAGQGLELSVLMSPGDAGGTYTYEWFKDDGTAAGLSLGSSAQPTHLVTTYSHDAFWVKVTKGTCTSANGVNYVLSPRAYVRVWNACVLEPVTISPAAAEIDPAASLTLQAFTDWPNVRYDWYRGAAGDTRVKLTPVTGHNDQLLVDGTPATYWVRITNNCGQALDSNAASITRRDGPNASCGPIAIRGTSPDPEIPAGTATTLSADATSAQGIAQYQWRQRTPDGGSDISIGGSSPSIQVQPSITTIYSVSMSSACGATALSRDIYVHVTSCGTNHFTTNLPATTQTDNTLDTPMTVATSEPVVRFDWYSGASGDPHSTLIGTTTTGSFLLPRRDTPASVWARAVTAAGCSFDSRATYVDVCVVPTIAETADVSVSASPGQYHSAGFTYGGNALQYQWFIGPAGNVAASQALQTTNDLILVHPSATTKYWVRVSNRCGTVDSPNYIVSICPVVGGISSSKPVVMANGTVSLTVTAQGSELAYHWYRGHTGDRSAPFGASAATVTTPAITNTSNTFWVDVVSGSCNTSSAEIVVPLCDSLGGTWAPAVTSSKVGQQQIVGITGVVTGAQATFYSGPAGDVAVSTIITGPSLNYSMSITPSQTTTYWARLAADNGICTTDTAPLTIQVCVPQITTQPQAPSAPINAGATAHFSVIADLPGATYQWYSGQNALPGATASALDVTPSVDTTYWVRVIGSCQAYVDSQVVTVAICRPPAITAQPVSTNALPNGTALSVTATGTALSYQWYAGASGTTTSPIGSGTSVTVNPSQTASYWVRVSGSCGSADSATAVVSVCPTITSQPVAASPYVQPGASTTITAAASGASIVWHWYVGQPGDISHPVGTSSATLNTGPLTTSTTYWVAPVSGTCQSQSQTVTVNVCNLSVSWNVATTQVRANQTQTISLSGYPAGVQATFYKGTTGNVAASTVVAGPAAVYSTVIAPPATTTYWARITDPSTGCYADTTALVITVCIPTITTQPQPQPAMVNPGGSSTMTVVADIPSTYQWFNGSTAISGATSATYVASPSVDTTYKVRVTGSCGTSVDSQTVTVTVCKPPAITAQPVSTNALAGGTTLAVTATGTALTYQWYQGASGTTTTPLGTSSSLTVNPSQTTSYWVKVSGTCGSVNSNTAIVSVCPTITAQPAAAKSYVQPGTSTTITVAASGSPLAYQWYTGPVGDITHPVGTNAAALTTAALNATTTYWVSVSSGTCATSSQAVTVNVCNLSVSWAAATTQVRSGVSQTLSLTGVPAGAEAVFYRGTSGNVAGSTVIAGPTTTYSTVVAPASTTSYWARITAPSTGCYADTATLTINVCIPRIAQQPQSVTIASGSSTTLQVATDVTPATYQWFTGTTPISGQTAAALTVSPASTTSYWVRVTGSCTSSIDSATATVTVCQPAAITGQPSDAPPVTPNHTSTLGVTATGTGLTYQWYVGNSGTTTSPVSGATSATLSRNVTTSEKYWVRVTGACGTSVNSNSAWMSVYPTITTQPASVSMNTGSTTTLSVQASGTYLHYQWYRNDTAHPVGTDSATYATGALTTDQTYFVNVTSGIATTQSSVAAVTMCTGPSAALSVQNVGACKNVYASVGGDDLGNTSFAWYQGQKGDMSHPGAFDYTFNTCATNTDFWVRLTNVNTGCYTDTDPIHVF